MGRLVGRTFPTTGKGPAKRPAKGRGKAGSDKGREPEKAKTARAPKE